MAKYAFGLRNVRAAQETTAVGVKDAPRGPSHYIVHNGGSAPTTAQLTALLEDALPSFDPAVVTSMVAQLRAMSLSSTVRADETTGAGQWRYGKQVFQAGVGYHASSDASAIAAINWKDLA